MSGRDLCIMACTFCREPLFREWIGQLGGSNARIDENDAKAFILELCEVTSRSHLDQDHVAAQRFHELVRVPFLAWKEERDGD